MSKTVLVVGNEPTLNEYLAPAYEAQGYRPYFLAAAEAESEEAITAAVQKIENETGQIDVFIWAVINSSTARFGEVTPAYYKGYMQSSVHTAFHFTKACLRGMERRRYGRFLYLTSLLANLGDEDALAAVAAGCLNTFAKSVAREEARKGITANALALGLVNDWEALNKELVQKFYQHYFPYRRQFTFEDLARQVITLTTGEQDLLNGQVIRFDGGTL